jgi:hypothetical protein
MNKVNIFLDIIEYLYYFSGIFVGIGVIFAIIQYHLIKKDTKIKYNREITSWTNELLRSFYKEILPKYEQLCKNLSENQFFLSKDIIKINIDNEQLIESCNNYIKALSEKNKINDMKDLAINLQILAVGLSHGNADIDMAKNVISRKYINILETVLPCIIIDKDIELYKECIELFNNWNYEKKMHEHEKQAKTLKNVYKDLVEYSKNEL